MSNDIKLNQAEAKESTVVKDFDLIKASIAGTNIIEASAGTGKTYSIEGLYVRILLLNILENQNKTTEVESILVVTYTEAATAELKIRIFEKLKATFEGFKLAKVGFDQSGKIERDSLAEIDDDFIKDLIWSFKDKIENPELGLLNLIINKLDVALLSFDEAAIFTIHAFCKRMLTDYSLESKSGFEFEFITNQERILDEISNDYWRKQAYGADQKYASFFLSLFSVPDKVKEQFKPIVEKQYIKIKPEAELTANWFSDLSKEYKQVKSIWDKEKEDIENLLNLGTLDKRSFKSIPEIISFAEDYFSADGPNGLDLKSDWRKNLEKLTDTFIKKKTAKKYKDNPIQHQFFKKFESYYNLVSSIKEQIVASLLAELSQKLKERKEEMNILCFSDLITNLDSALKAKEGNELESKIRERFKAALIDEFQDTDPVQYSIFKQLFAGQIPLFLIGDPKQSIYNFRGADIFAYFKAVKDANQKNQLSTNWRSCADLIDAFNAVFSSEGEEKFIIEEKIKYVNSKAPKAKERRSLIIQGKEPEPFKIWAVDPTNAPKSAEAEKLFIEATVAEIIRLLNLAAKKEALIKTDSEARPIEPKDIAILVSSHVQADKFQLELRKRNVPSVQRGTKSIFETKEFREFKIFLNAVLNYQSESALKALFMTEIFELSGDELVELFDDSQHWEKKLDQFQQMYQLWQNKGLSSMVQKFMKTEKIREQFLKYEGGERKLSNFLQILEILQRVQLEQHLEGFELLYWMEQIQLNPDGEKGSEVRLETDDEALSILTIHASKGLQYPIVFSPFSGKASKPQSEVIFHDQENEDALTWDLLKEGKSKKAADLEAAAEKIRLAYVAFTRAKICCYTTWDGNKKSCHTTLFGADKDDWEKQLEQKSNGAIKVETQIPTLANEVYTPPKADTQDLSLNKNEKKLTSSFGFYSFSSLHNNSKAQHEDPKNDVPEEPIEIEEEEVEETIDFMNLHDFPGGTKTGNMFHEILEDSDFNSEEAPLELVNSKLENYGFEPEWNQAVADLVQRIKQLKFESEYSTDSNFSLGQIPARQVVKEMSFYFSLGSSRLEDIISIFKKSAKNKLNKSLQKAFEAIDLFQLDGFMTGFIDLVFCHDGRYYVLDWKTNTLGDSNKDYSPAKLRDKINEFQYNLQFLIYTIALHKYLKTRIPDYKFSTHFGGVYYLFLRGIESGSTATGVYYESFKGSESLVEELSDYFTGVEK